MKFKTTLFWIAATILTLAAAVYQRKTGPTYPKAVEINTSQGIVEVKLIRSHGGDNDCDIDITMPNEDITGTVQYRRFPTNDEWVKTPLIRHGNTLEVALPHQEPAGKIEYKIALFEKDQLLNEEHELHTVVRYKGSVPAGILIPHIFFIFFAMLLSNLTCILAIDKHKRTLLYSKITLGFLLLGGLIFGPLVQLHAFGELWTGIPLGWDLTDNKTLIAFVVWLLALVVSIKQKRVRYDLIIVAAIVMLLIFSIPHSMFGSELDYATGTVKQA